MAQARGTEQSSTLPSHFSGILNSSHRSRFFPLPFTAPSQHLKHLLIVLSSQHVHLATKQRAAPITASVLQDRNMLLFSLSILAREKGF